MGNFKIKSIWENKNTGGNVPADLANRVQNLETKSSNNETNITNLQQNTAKLNQNNTFTGTNTFNNQIVANEGLTTANEKAITSGNLELGLGSTIAYITSEDTSNKTLKFGGRSGRGRFNLDLETQSQLMGIKDPTADYHAANKKYVDNRIKTRTLTQTINANSTYTINPTTGYQVVSVMVGRKRTNDGMYFFEYQTTLNKQVFLDNTTFKVYNQGNVSGFSNNEFKIVILEMKV